MTDLSDSAKLVYKAKHKIRFVTAASLFDGHDASINIIRRILQASGAEVIHLGHNRSVDEIVTAALPEDVEGIAVSSDHGGDFDLGLHAPKELKAGDARSLAQIITGLELGTVDGGAIRAAAEKSTAPVLG